jgi:DNA-binding transcriptional MerR regulator
VAPFAIEPLVSRPLLPIGSFASRCRLSVKALRHYDELGLLRPERVDVATGYRYYDHRQAPAAIAIAVLRSLDVPLPVIRELFARPDSSAITEILDRERARRALEIMRAETALRSIERLMRAGTIFPYEIALRDEPAQTVLVVEATTTSELHVVTGTALAAELLEKLRSLGRTPIGRIMCLLPPSPGDSLVLQMCAAISDPPPGEHVITLPAGPAAVARHVGPYEEMGLADHALHAWVEERGLEAIGPIREVYLNDPAGTAPEALETDVLLPVNPSARTR